MREYLVDVNYICDPRGVMGFFEESIEYLNNIKRIFWITVDKQNQVRGDHAHKTTSQLMVCLTGEVVVECCDQYENCMEYILKPSGKGLMVPPMIWSKQTYIISPSSLIVICDDYFNEKEYIRDKEKFFEHSR